jgi:hypothetical protein
LLKKEMISVERDVRPVFAIAQQTFARMDSVGQSRMPHSDGCLRQAYPSESSEAFCEGHNVSFDLFGE